MSYTDDFWNALEEEKKKKKKKNGSSTSTQTTVKSSGSSYTDEFFNELQSLQEKSVAIDNSFLSRNGRFEDEDIAPVKEEDDSLIDLFDAGALKAWGDGKVDWDDLTALPSAILGTAGDAVVGVGKGAFSFAEGLADLAGHGIYEVRKAFGETEADLAGYKKAINESTTDNIFGGADEYLDQYSVLGRSTRGLAEGAGQLIPVIAANVVGGPALGNALLGASSFGSGMSEAYMGGATDGEALTYGAVSATTEILTEKLFGGLGKGLNAAGFNKGVLPFDDMAAKAVSKFLKSPTAKNVAEWGVKSGFEAIEEVIAGYISAHAKKGTFRSEEEFAKILEEENLLEQAFIGFGVSGIAQGGDVRIANKTGRDFVTGNTQNEQAVIDKVVEDRIAEAEKDGKKLSGREKNKILDKVMRDMERGYIDTDTIEEVLGDRTAYDSLAKEAEEYDTLYNTATGQLSKAQQDRLAELESKNKANPYKDAVKTAKDQYSQSVFEKVKGDRLVESYLDKARVGEDFQADFNKYKGTKHEDAAKKTLENAIKAGANNTNRVHDLVDMAADLSSETGYVYDFKDGEQIKNDFIERKTKEIAKLEAIANRTDAQNEKIAKLKDLVAKVQSNEVTVNGNVDSNGIVLNLDSAKPLNRIIGHEITHTVEKAKHYEKLRDSLFAYAKSKGVDIDAELAMKALEYEGVEGTTAEAELVADLVGDYLFTDSDYVKSLTTENRNLAQRIYDEIKYFLTKATKGSKEERELLKVKHEFEKSFRETAEVSEMSDSEVKHSLRTNPPPKETGVAYKVFFVKDGKLYPPMVANPEGADTPIGVWLDADVGTSAPASKTGRAQVKAGGKGTQGGSGSLAFRPGWHLGDLPRASQFDRVNPETGKKELFPENFVWAEVEYAKDVDYQEEAMSYGYTENGKFRHAYAGLPRLPENGYYRYRTNPKPDTVPWIITGAMKVNRLLSDAEVNEILEKNGVAPVHRQGGDVGLDKFGFDDGGTAKYSLGYHAGDLGKAEGYWNMMSSNRGTGHFGTGTYFVGDETKISDSHYGNRPHEKVDFDNYHLFKPVMESDGFDLHSALKYINDSIFDYPIAKMSFDELWDVRKQADEAEYTLWDDDATDAEKVAAQKVLDDFKERFASVGYDPDHMDAQKLYEELNDITKAYRLTRSKLEMLFWRDMGGLSYEEQRAKIDSIMQGIYDEVSQIEDAYAAKHEDSPSTRFMKALGYEGIDVRGFNGLDNTTYGSVIYDLKGEDLARKQEIGTAKYSLSANAKSDVHSALVDKNYAGEVKLTDTSPSILLSQKGVRNLPMVMNASHIRENIFTEAEAKSNGLRVSPNINYHGLGEELFLKVIDDLDNVREAYRGTKNADDPNRRENYFLLISQQTDKDGNIINVPVFINEKGVYNRVFIDTNKIATVFGRSELREYIKRQINQGNLVRIKNRSTQASESTSPIKADYGMDASYADNVAQVPENVKTQFSLSDSGGRKLSPAVQNRFAKSKVVDEDGNLKAVYHGTASGEFTIFDKSKGSAEGDFGSGFYFTDNEYDVSNNYEGGGPDFENKVARLAERIEQEEDISYAEAEARARDELYKGDHKFEVYLNIENPAVVGETTLLDYESFAEEYDRNDYDSDEDYESDVEYLISDKIDEIIWEVEKNVDVCNTDGLAEVLWNAVTEGGIGIEQLKANINNLHLEDSEGNLVGNEVTRQIIESLGYDGIIDPTVSNKWNMDMEEGTTHYIVFKPNQIKSVTNENPTDNPDIHLSLSNRGEQFAPIGRNDFYGKDFHKKSADDIAPVAENATTTPITESAHDVYTPFEERAAGLEAQLYQAEQTIKALDIETEALFRDYAEQKLSDDEFATRWNDIDKRYDSARQEQERLSAEISAEDSQRFSSLDDADVPPETEAPYNDEAESIAPLDPFAERDMYAVGNRKVKAYMYENPEFKPFFQEAANVMLGDLYNSTKGERLYNDQVHYDTGGENGWSGVSRHTTSDIADLLDQWGYTYDEIEAGLNAIIEDNGKENNAVSKRIEFMLDNRLRNGYKTVDGDQIPRNEEYISLLKEKQIDNYRRESFDSFMENADKYAPPEEDIAPLKTGSPIEGKQDALNGFAQAEQGKTTGATRKALHESIVSNIKSKFAEKGFDFDAVLKNAKNLSTFSTVDNTPQRVMEKSLGYKEGQILGDLTVNQVAKNETEGIKWLNKVTNRKDGLLAQLSKQYNIKPGSKESSAAQMYAEGFYVDSNNDIVAYGDAELAKDFPDVNVQNNIKGLARDPRVRQFYDETLAMINESRTRNAYPAIQRLDNYFLHFRAMDDTFSRLGIPFNPNDIRAKDLPTDLNGVTADTKPGQPYFASAKHREGKRTSFDLLGGLERYATSAKNQIYHIDDIQTLRALRNYIADTYGQAHGLEDLDSLSEAEQQERIEEVFGSHLSTFAKFLHEEANVLAGKTALIDRGIEGLIGRRAITTLDTIRKQVGSNLIGYNVSSSLTNFDAVARAFAKTNKADFLKSFAQFTANKVRSAFGKSDGFMENNPTAIRRNGADRFYRTPFQKAGDAGYALMGMVDNISTELIVRTKYNELTRKGMSDRQAVIETDKWVSRLMGDRSLGQQPLLFNSKTLGLFTQFQLEVRNNLDSMFYDTIQEAKVSNEDIVNAKERNAKTAAKITSTMVQTAVAMHLFGSAFEAVAGYNPTFDIIDVLMKAFGMDDEEEEPVLDNIEEAFLALLDDLPYTSTFTGGRIPISNALPIKELLTGKDQYGNEKDRLETLGEALPYYVLPGGYGQIKKTYQGLDMFSDEHPVAGSYTDSGNLRFPVEDTFGNRLQAGLFGQYASENARDYFDNGRSPLKEKQIQEYIDVDIPIRDYWEYREGLADQKTIEDKFDYIAGLDLPVSKKNILINNIVDREESVDLEGYEDFSSYDEFDFATKNPGKYAVSQAVGGYDAYTSYMDALGDITADKDENGKSISGSKKEKVINYIESLPIDYGMKIILFKSMYDSKEDRNNYNADIVEYLDSRDDISYEDMVTILTELGMRVEGNNVYWD